MICRTRMPALLPRRRPTRKEPAVDPGHGAPAGQARRHQPSESAGGRPVSASPSQTSRRSRSARQPAGRRRAAAYARPGPAPCSPAAEARSARRISQRLGSPLAPFGYHPSPKPVGGGRLRAQPTAQPVSESLQLEVAAESNLNLNLPTQALRLASISNFRSPLAAPS